MNTKVRKKNETAIPTYQGWGRNLEGLLQNAQIEYQDGCVGVEVKNDTHYLYMYDRFNNEPGEYYFAKVPLPGKQYEPIELSEPEKDFLKNELFKVWEVEHGHYLEQQTEQEQNQQATECSYWDDYREYIDHKFYQR